MNGGIRKKKPSCSTDPVSVSPEQRVCDFPRECLVVSAGRLHVFVLHAEKRSL